MARTFLFALSLLIPLAQLSSCNGSCAGFDCVRGDCVSGACDCDKGYEGNNCGTAWSEKFVGSYEGKDCFDASIARYTFTATNRPDSLRYLGQHYALVRDGSILEFPEQTATDEGVEYLLSGSGQLTANGIRLNLLSKYPTFELSCDLQLTRVN